MGQVLIQTRGASQLLDDEIEIPLDMLNTGERAAVFSLSAGRAADNRLVSLGFTPGVELDMVQNFGHGPLIVALRGTRVALGRGEAAKILVRRNLA
jgi:ferrous iron transport protein A